MVGYLLKPDVVSDDSSIKNFIFDHPKPLKNTSVFCHFEKQISQGKKNTV
jgi:hypothetical protein